MEALANNKHHDQQAVYVKNLRLKFPGEGSLLFKDLSFTVKRGEKVLLLGPSGCGKSTLLQVLSGLIPHSIEIPLTYDAIQLPASYGFVFQDPDTQFCMPYVDEELGFVLENMQIPREKMDNLIQFALQQVGLGNLQQHTLIQHLSQGMKQRLALASVLLLEPDVLFLDEPSALLDPEGTGDIWNAVKQVSNDKTVIIVEHKIDHIAEWVDRIVLFNDLGEIIADGDPDQVFTSFHTDIKKYGIWYPGVWNDYLQSRRYKEIMMDRKNVSEQIDKSASDTSLGDQAKDVISTEDIIYLQNFRGFHGKQEKIHVPEVAVQRESWITIVGENGAGKSTLLLSLMHLLRTSGTYELYGEKVNLDMKKQEPPKELALVFQNPELQFVTQTVGEEIGFSLQLQGEKPRVIQTKVEELTDTFYLPVDPLHHPYQLSIGQKRRLSVASAIVNGAPILLLDEPTFGQDARSTFVMLEQLEELRKNGTTIIMVTHDMNIVNHFATHQWMIEQGKLISVEEIFHK